MAYFNRSLFDDIKKTVRNVAVDVRLGRAPSPRESHDFVGKVTMDTAVGAISVEYDINLRGGTDALSRAESQLRGVAAQFKIWEKYGVAPPIGIYHARYIRESTGDIRYRLYINASPFHISDLVHELFEILSIRICPHCHATLKEPGARTLILCPNCRKSEFTYRRRGICQNCHHPLPDFRSFCYSKCGRPIRGVVAIKMPYGLEKPNTLEKLQHLLMAIKFVLYLDESVPDLYRIIALLRKLPPAWFGKNVSRYTKPVAKGVGFAQQPTAEIAPEPEMQSIGAYFGQVAMRAYQLIQSDIPEGKVPTERDIVRIARIIYDEVEKFASVVHQPFG